MTSSWNSVHQTVQISSIYYWKTASITGLKLVSKMALKKSEHERRSLWKIPSWKTGLPFQIFRCFRKFSDKTKKKFLTGFSGTFYKLWTTHISYLVPVACQSRSWWTLIWRGEKWALWPRFSQSVQGLQLFRSGLMRRPKLSELSSNE